MGLNPEMRRPEIDILFWDREVVVEDLLMVEEGDDDRGVNRSEATELELLELYEAIIGLDCLSVIGEDEACNELKKVCGEESMEGQGTEEDGLGTYQKFQW
jgi:hypothetical protein